MKTDTTLRKNHLVPVYVRFNNDCIHTEEQTGLEGEINTSKQPNKIMEHFGSVPAADRIYHLNVLICSGKRHKTHFYMAYYKTSSCLL